MPKEINLDGTETSVIKALGLGGTEVSGDELMGRVQGIEAAELMDVVRGLLSVGYIDADMSAINDSEQFKKARFRVNSGYSRDLKEALDPRPEPPKSRRVRRE